MKTLLGQYDHISHAEQVVQQLLDSGLSREDINLVAANPEGETGHGADGQPATTLVAVRVQDELVGELRAMMEQSDPVELEERDDEWYGDGWAGYRTRRGPYFSGDVAKIRAETESDTSATGLRDGFRRHFESHYGSSGRLFTEYEPAYHYGYTLGANSEYRGRPWDEIEAEASRRWQRTFGHQWDDYRDAVRHGWQAVRAAVEEG
jgi:hypothetical protein